MIPRAPAESGYFIDHGPLQRIVRFKTVTFGMIPMYPRIL